MAATTSRPGMNQGGPQHCCQVNKPKGTERQVRQPRKARQPTGYRCPDALAPITGSWMQCRNNGKQRQGLGQGKKRAPLPLLERTREQQQKPLLPRSIHTCRSGTACSSVSALLLPTPSFDNLSHLNRCAHHTELWKRSSWKGQARWKGGGVALKGTEIPLDRWRGWKRRTESHTQEYGGIWKSHVRKERLRKSLKISMRSLCRNWEFGSELEANRERFFLTVFWAKVKYPLAFHFSLI